ncbi:hypothetical protein LJT99_12980 [Lentisphaerae bacterium WC36]|nr:hypothetical protein LJT99_12980 [Lentisphaerae bacterium WC36]
MDRPNFLYVDGHAEALKFESTVGDHSIQSNQHFSKQLVGHDYVEDSSGGHDDHDH